MTFHTPDRLVRLLLCPACSRREGGVGRACHLWATMPRGAGVEG